MRPLRYVMIETTRSYEVLTLKMRCTVHPLMSGLCHSQLEGPQGTWPLIGKHSCRYTFNSLKY